MKSVKSALNRKLILALFVTFITAGILTGGYILYARNQNAKLNTGGKKLYLQTSVDSPQVNPQIESYFSSTEVYEIDGGILNKKFAGSSDNHIDVLGVSSKGLVVSVGSMDSIGNAPPKTLSLYNTKTNTLEPLVTTESKNLYGSVSPDGKRVVFAEHCGLYCEEDAPLYIKLLDLETGETETIYTNEKYSDNTFLVPLRWVNNEVVLLNAVYEIGSGPLSYAIVRALNVVTHEVTELSLDQDATSISVNPNGGGVVFTTFGHDSENQKYTSFLGLTTLDGATKILLRRGNDEERGGEYQSAVWLDDERVAVMIKEVRQIDWTCPFGPCLEGENRMQVVNIKTGEVIELDISTEPTALFYGDKEHLYFVSQTGQIGTMEQLYALHMYNFATGVDEVILRSHHNIFRVAD